SCTDTPTSALYPLSLHDALPIYLLAEFRRLAQSRGWRFAVIGASAARLRVYRSLGLRAVYLGDEAVLVPAAFSLEGRGIRMVRQDRKSTRQNSSHSQISYAVFCL